MKKIELIDIIAGARPNFMKIAPIIKELQKRRNKESKFQYRLIHTGQHYDKNMSQTFFDQLGIPKPDINFNIKSGTQAEQTADIMVNYEKLLIKSKSNICIVVGDVNSTMACAIVAKKFCIPVAHVEAGIRSDDLTMPEEINRIVTDSITDYFFTTSLYANRNLTNIGINENRIFFVGNTMIDTLVSSLKLFSPPMFWNKYNLNKGEYFVLTMHRPSNVDNIKVLNKLLNVVGNGAGNYSVIFPVHPRTLININKIKKYPNNIICVEPQPYYQFNYLIMNSIGVVTDSGGITEEATVMRVPCITLRNSTERPETVNEGTNELAGDNEDLITEYLNRIRKNEWKAGTVPDKWDGKAAKRIVDIILKNLINKK